GACLRVTEGSMLHLRDAHLFDPGFTLAIDIDEGVIDSGGRVAQGARLTPDQDDPCFVFFAEFVVEFRAAIGRQDAIAALALLGFVSAFRHGASLPERISRICPNCKAARRLPPRRAQALA